ncbi:MAG: TldD/PmbA family protein [Pseudomonadota bacterium]
MPHDLPALTEALLSAAKAAGADAADALSIASRSVSIEVLDGALEQAERSESVEIGLRVLVGPRQATVASSDLTQATMTEMAERAVAMARLAPEDPHVGLADPADLTADRDARDLDLTDSAERDPAALEAQALAAEAAAKAVPGVAQVQGASAGETRRDVWLAASNGFSGGYGRTSYGCSAVAISGAGLGMERDYDFDMRTHLADLRDPAEIGRIAGERAIARAGAKKPPTGAFPVVFDERISSSLIGHLVGAANGASIARGSSWLRAAMGEAVLPANLDLVEEPRRTRTSGSRPFDAEGLPTATSKIVEAGVLRRWILDLATARKLGLASTANAVRGTNGPPSPSPSNLSLTEGTQSQAELLAEMGTGLLVTALIGSSINPTTGDYSRGASGFWVENGEVTYPVNECTIAGNLRDMLMSVTPANDARAHLSTIVPSLRVEGLTIAGA